MNAIVFTGGQLSWQLGKFNLVSCWLCGYTEGALVMYCCECMTPCVIVVSV